MILNIKVMYNNVHLNLIHHIKMILLITIMCLILYFNVEEVKSVDYNSAMFLI